MVVVVVVDMNSSTVNVIVVEISVLGFVPEELNLDQRLNCNHVFGGSNPSHNLMSMSSY